MPCAERYSPSATSGRRYLPREISSTRMACNDIDGHATVPKVAEKNNEPKPAIVSNESLPTSNSSIGTMSSQISKHCTPARSTEARQTLTHGPRFSHSPAASALPSLYSTSLLSDDQFQDAGPPSANSCSLEGTRSCTSCNGSMNPNLARPTNHELFNLIQFFQSKMMYFVPSITPIEVNDIPNVIKFQRPLALCIAFVAARLVPGCMSTREMLIPHVLAVLRLKYTITKTSEDEMWTLIQVSAVLFAQASPDELASVTKDSGSEGELSFWALKASLETLALRISLHRSGEEVTTLVKNDIPHLNNSPAFRRYIFWLWLFTLSQRMSLLTRTPPTIREDVMIRSAPNLLKDVTDELRVRRILGEVDLCLLWCQAGLRQCDLGEWWNAPHTDSDLKSALNVLKDVNAALRIWAQRWCPEEEEGTNPNSEVQPRRSTISFHYRFTRFFISTYASRFLYSTATGVDPPTNSPDLVDFVLESVKAAIGCCDLFRDLSPLSKDTARYMPDIDFSMVAFACRYVLQAAECLDYADNEMDSHLNSVRRTAQLMTKLAIYPTHAPKTYGDRILAESKAFQSRRHFKSGRMPSSANILHAGKTTSLGFGSLLSETHGVANDRTFTEEAEYDPSQHIDQAHWASFATQKVNSGALHSTNLDAWWRDPFDDLRGF